MSNGVWPEVLIGDVRSVLPSLASESVHMVCTSPPFWNLRDYNCEGQIGLERTFADHLDVLAAVFNQVKRVMRKDAVLFINYGDAYACSPNGRKAADIVNDDRTFRDKPANTVGSGFKPKDLMLMPHRLAIRLQEEGWWVRNDIVWAKANPLPESVTDRFTRSHEYVFMLTKSPHYYFDQDAVREQTGSEMTAEEYAERTAPGATWESGGITRHAGANKHDGGKSHPSGRNKRSVFFLPTQPLPFEHYAAFPEALVEPLVLCATSEAGCCPECGAPWKRDNRHGIRYNMDYGNEKMHEVPHREALRGVPQGGISKDGTPHEMPSMRERGTGGPVGSERRSEACGIEGAARAGSGEDCSQEEGLSGISRRQAPDAGSQQSLFQNTEGGREQASELVEVCKDREGATISPASRRKAEGTSSAAVGRIHSSGLGEDPSSPEESLSVLQQAIHGEASGDHRSCDSSDEGRTSRPIQHRRRLQAVQFSEVESANGWHPTCSCGHSETVPAVVLDPFAGSGTTLRVATRLGRRSIGIELSETYVRDILRKRTAQGGLGL